MKIFSGNANPDLAREIAAYLGTQVGDAVINRFNNGEVQVMINESVRGKDVFVIQRPADPASMTMSWNCSSCATLQTCQRKTYYGRCAFYGYARQDRKARGREPITAKLMADLMAVSGITRVVTIDLHAAQIQGFFDIPVDHMPGGPILADYIKEKGFSHEDMIVVSPDLGGVSRARKIATRLNCGIALSTSAVRNRVWQKS